LKRFGFDTLVVKEKISNGKIIITNCTVNYDRTHFFFLYYQICCKDSQSVCPVIFFTSHLITLNNVIKFFVLHNDTTFIESISRWPNYSSHFFVITHTNDIIVSVFILYYSHFPPKFRHYRQLFFLSIHIYTQLYEIKKERFSFDV